MMQGRRSSGMVPCVPLYNSGLRAADVALRPLKCAVSTEGVQWNSVVVPTEATPGVLGATKTSSRVEIPKPIKQSPSWGRPFVKALELLAADMNSMRGGRTYAETYILRRPPSPRFSGTKIAGHIWLLNTAACGISLDLGLRARSVTEWGTPITALGFADGLWVETLVKLRGSARLSPGVATTVL